MTPPSAGVQFPMCSMRTSRGARNDRPRRFPSGRPATARLRRRRTTALGGCRRVGIWWSHLYRQDQGGLGHPRADASNRRCQRPAVPRSARNWALSEPTPLVASSPTRSPVLRRREHEMRSCERSQRAALSWPKRVAGGPRAKPELRAPRAGSIRRLIRTLGQAPRCPLCGEVRGQCLLACESCFVVVRYPDPLGGMLWLR